MRGFFLSFLRRTHGYFVIDLYCMTTLLEASDLDSLRRIKERYDLAIEGSNDGIWDWDIQSGLAFFSRKFRSLMGYSDADHLDAMDSLLQVVHPEDLQPTIEALQAHLNNHEPYIHEYRLKTTSQGYRWFLVRGQARWNENGEAYRMAGTLTDIHDSVMNRQALKQAGEVHHEQELRFKQLLSALPDILMQVNSDGIILDLHIAHNSSFVKPTAIRKLISEVLPIECAIQIKNAIKKVLAGHFNVTVDFTIALDGKECYYSIRVVPYSTDNSALLIIRDVTEVYLNKFKLEDSDSLNETIIERLTDGFALVDANGVHQRVNDSFCKMVGYTKEELIGSGIPHLYWLKDNEKSMLNLFKRAIKEDLIEVEVDFKKKSGEIFTALVAPTVIKNKDGTVRHAFSTIKDISALRREQQRIEELNIELEKLVEKRSSELIKKDKMFEQAQMLVNLGSFEWGIQNDRVIWSEKMYDIYGLDSKDGVPSKQYLQASVHDEDRDAVNAIVGDAVENNRSYELETRIVRKNGEVRSVLIKALPEYDEFGTPKRVIGVVKDITDIKEKEKSLEKLGDTLELATNQSGVGVWEWFPETNELIWNSTMYAIYGVRTEEFEGYSTWRNSVHPEDLERVEYEQQLGIVQRGQFSNTFRIVLPDGSIRYLQSNGNANLDANGAIVSILGTNWDITKDKQTEATLRQMNDELESFAYSVSHDLRAPLRGIDGWSLALLEDYGDKMDENGKLYIQRVRQQTQQMGDLIDDILKLARVNRVDFEEQEVNLKEIFIEILKKNEVDFDNVKIETGDDDDFKVLGDSKLLAIMLTNLLENANKFSSKKDQPLIQFFSTMLNGRRCFVISDNGVGFNVSEAKNLFAPFQRFHRKSDFPGTGIGLATCQRVIRIHDGDIWIESEPDCGTKVFFSIGGKVLS